ncbi:hypothetical protein R1flu_013769 [Riccia fluitans]|uniref:Uncharacterized protein n=1 Tax=Riccia fluitans TaxID=41844 RepID=A0ABD1YEC4_9MARC
MLPWASKAGIMFLCVSNNLSWLMEFYSVSLWKIDSGGHINPAVTQHILGRKLSILRALIYMAAQVLGGICGAGFVKAWQKTRFQALDGGTNFVADGLSSGAGLGAEILGTFILVYVVYSATDAKRKARDSHVPVLTPLPIVFAVFVVHLVTIPITGCGINPARSFGPAVVWNHGNAWDDQFVIRTLPLGEHLLFPTMSMRNNPVGESKTPV